MKNIDARKTFAVAKAQGDLKRAIRNGEETEELYDDLFDKILDDKLICEGSTSYAVYDKDNF